MLNLAGFSQAGSQYFEKTVIQIGHDFLVRRPKHQASLRSSEKTLEFAR
jgi:hypothetical protein